MQQMTYQAGQIVAGRVALATVGAAEREQAARVFFGERVAALVAVGMPREATIEVGRRLGLIA